MSKVANFGPFHYLVFFSCYRTRGQGTWYGTHTIWEPILLLAAWRTHQIQRVYAVMDPSKSTDPFTLMCPPFLYPPIGSGETP